MRATKVTREFSQLLTKYLLRVDRLQFRQEEEEIIGICELSLSPILFS